MDGTQYFSSHQLNAPQGSLIAQTVQPRTIRLCPAVAIVAINVLVGQVPLPLTSHMWLPALPAGVCLHSPKCLDWGVECTLSDNTAKRQRVPIYGCPCGGGALSRNG